MSLISTKDLISDVFLKLFTDGTFFDSSSSEQSIFQGSFKELLNYSGTIQNSHIRVIDSPDFNIGFAIARFIYLIQGVNTLEEISFYAPRSSEYSDDGKYLFGSSYGYKIFQKNRFWKMIEKLKNTENSKRLYFPIFNEDDFLRDSKDIPCVVGFLLSPRKNVLHASLIMRANDAHKLLPYNLFEFSLLQECVAVAAGMKLGSFGYYAGTIHLRGDDTQLERNPFESATSFEMNHLLTFSKKVLKLIIEKEKRLRNELPSTDDEKYNFLIQEIVEGLDSFWQEIFYILGDYGYSKCHKKHPQVIENNYPLYNLYRKNIS